MRSCRNCEHIEFDNRCYALIGAFRWFCKLTDKTINHRILRAIRCKEYKEKEDSL